MTEPPCDSAAPAAPAAASPSPRVPRRLKYVEAVLCIGFTLAFLVWTYLSAPGVWSNVATCGGLGCLNAR